MTVNKRDDDKDGLRCIAHIKDEALFHEDTHRERSFELWHGNSDENKGLPIFATQQRLLICWSERPM